ncbi:MAG: phosphatidate cytidylyltransferase [Bifidobacteriaceae bacterium]|nr:phosphatidate cytidylyltransferase [Bifidobacteriaceae bacterium]
MEKPHPKNAAGTREIINERTGRNMPQAIATGTGLVLLILLFLLFLPPICFVALILLFMLLAIRELQVSFSLAAIHLPAVVLDCGLIGVLLTTYYAHDHVAATGASLVLCLLVSSIAAAASPHADRFSGKALEAKKLGVRDNHPWAVREVTFSGRARDVSSTVFVTLYIVLLASFLVLPLVRPQYRVLEAITLFVPSLSDIGGLIFGAAFGKHKLSSRISPKKSYEGLFGSIVFAIIGAIIFYCFAFPSDFYSGGWWKPVTLGFVVAFVGTFGDLCASMLKRDLGIKDLGHLLKGHGGVLDRIDSILISAPFTFLLLSLFIA